MKRFRARPSAPLVAMIASLLLASACGHRAPAARPPGSLASPAGSGSEILERDEMTIPVITMEELLKHRLPNVLVRRSGSRAWIEIRGQGSISSGTEALIIIDGIQNTSHGLLSMNPDDVERIQVLKDGSAAIYGMRAGNGVLVVTTRRD